MKIERVIIDGFGQLCNQQIRFASDRVNLMVEDNEFGKSTLAEAILVALYGFSRERTTVDKLSGFDARRPLSGSAYKVTLELTVQGHPFRVTRDCDNDTVSIIDLGSRQDVTADFFPKKGGPQVGERLLGVSREQFEHTCFVGHHSLNYDAASTDLKQNLERAASSSGESKTAAQAIAALKKGLQPLRGAIMGDSIKADTEIRRVENKIAELNTNLEELDNNRRRHDSNMSKLSVLGELINAKRKERVDLEALQAAAYAQELSARVSEQEQLRLETARLRRESDELKEFATFPGAINDNLVTWLAQLNTKSVELSRRGNEVRNTKEELASLISQRDARFSSLVAFTSNDRDALVGVREQLTAIASQTVDVEESLQAELESLSSRGILPARFEELDLKLSALDSPTREAAVLYPQQHDQLVAEHGRSERQHEVKSQLIVEIDAERRRRERNALYLLLAGAIATAAFGVTSLLTDSHLLWSAVSAIGFVVALLSLVFKHQAAVFRSDDRSKATLDMEHAATATEKIKLSLQTLERQWNSTAKSVALDTANELASACLEYFQLGEALKAFRRLKNELNLLAQQKHTVQSEGFPHLQRAGRATSVSSELSHEEIGEICRDLEAFFSLRHQIKTLDDRLIDQQAEEQRTSEDVAALNSRLRLGFHDAGIQIEDSSFDAGYKLFQERLERHRRFTRIETEDLPLLQKRVIPMNQLSAWKEELEAANSKVIELGATELVPEQTHGYYSDDLGRINSELEQLAAEQAGINLVISNALGAYERESQELVETRDELEAHLSRVISYRDAVLVALNKIITIAQDVHREWSISLNGICEAMLLTTNSDYKSIRFGDDLSFTVETGEQAALLTMRDITGRLSLGAREQLFLLQRLAVSRFLSDGEVKLPLILDDPLVTSDDGRFLRLMRFVIEALPQEHQVITLSCHKGRHEWLREQLGNLFIERVNLVQLEPIRLD